MKRWITINPFDGSETFDYDLPKDVWEDSVVDRSHFIPVAEALKNLEGNASALHMNMNFDFKDGKDTGVELPPSRRPGADITEVQEYVEKIDRSAKEKVQSAVEKQKAVDAMKKASQVQSAEQAT